MKVPFIVTLSFLLLTSLSLGVIEPSLDLQRTLFKTEPGNSLTFDSTINESPFLSYTFTDSGPSMIFSDDPEYLKSEGICCQETVGMGTVRVYLYNVNASTTDFYKFAIVLKNLSNETERVTIVKQGTQKPGKNYVSIGRKSLLEFYKSNLNDIFLIDPHHSELLDPTLDREMVSYDGLAHGIYEFYCTQSTQITLCGLNWYADTLKTYESLSVLKDNGKNAGRGLYPNTNRQFEITKTVDTKDGVQKIRLADGKTDTWLRGIDGTTGKQKNNAGNYGVMYTIDIPVISSDTQDMAILVMSQPSGNSGCSYSGVIGTNSKNNVTPSGYFLTPADRYAFVNATTASLVGIYRTSETSETITLEFSPPGASCLPADLIFVPVRKRE